MTRYLFRRLILAIPTIIGITIGTFALINLAPGDPLLAYANLETLDEDSLELARENLGLDDPLPVQYTRWLNNILQGNFGRSLITQRNVADEIAANFENTLRLTVTALIFSSLAGILIGAVSAIYQYSIVDYVFTLLSFIGLSTPGFFLALILVAVFALQFDLFPTSGMRSVTLADDATWTERWLDMLHHMVLPVIALSAASAASLARFTRSSFLEILNMDYLRTARAKGVRERTIYRLHALPNALLPIITIIALRLPGIFGGSVIVETIFNWPGIGLLSIRAATDKDYPMMMGITLIFALMVVVANLVADIMYVLFDPRVRYGN